MDRTSRRLTGWVVNLLCAAICLVGLAFIVPAAFGLERYVIAGGSMSGSIERGSIAFEEVVPVEELEVGDVITYMPPADSGVENLVTHRIVSIDGEEIRTQGDANADVDPWTFKLAAATQPRVSFAVPYAGYPLLALQDRETRMLAIGVPAAVVFLLAFAELLGLRRSHDDSESADSVAAADACVPAAGETRTVTTVLVPPQATTADQARTPRRTGTRIIVAGRVGRPAGSTAGPTVRPRTKDC